MAYHVYITRAASWSANVGHEISRQEWLDLVTKDPELMLDPDFGDAYAQWSGWDHYSFDPQNPPLFHWRQGNISFNAPDRSILTKMLDLATQLGARVQGEAGEIYLTPKPFAEELAQMWHDAMMEVSAFNHDYLGTEHLLLAIAAPTSTVAGIVLHSAGLTVEVLRTAVDTLVGRNPQRITGNAGRTPTLNRAIASAFECAQNLGQTQVSSGHVLFGLLAIPEGTARQIVERLGQVPDTLQAAVVAKLSERQTQN